MCVLTEVGLFDLDAICRARKMGGTASASAKADLSNNVQLTAAIFACRLGGILLAILPGGARPPIPLRTPPGAPELLIPACDGRLTGLGRVGVGAAPLIAVEDIVGRTGAEAIPLGVADVEVDGGRRVVGDGRGGGTAGRPDASGNGETPLEGELTKSFDLMIEGREAAVDVCTGRDADDDAVGDPASPGPFTASSRFSDDSVNPASPTAFTVSCERAAELSRSRADTVDGSSTLRFASVSTALSLKEAFCGGCRGAGEADDDEGSLAALVSPVYPFVAPLIFPASPAMDS